MVRGISSARDPRTTRARRRDGRANHVPGRRTAPRAPVPARPGTSRRQVAELGGMAAQFAPSLRQRADDAVESFGGDQLGIRLAAAVLSVEVAAVDDSLVAAAERDAEGCRGTGEYGAHGFGAV